MTQVAVDMAVAKLEEVAMQEHELLSPEVGSHIIHLRDKLEELQAFLRDADQKHRHCDNVLLFLWMKQVRQMAYEAEDAVDDFVLTVVSRCDNCCDFAGLFRILRQGHTMAAVERNLIIRIERIKKRLDEIAAGKDVHDLKNIPSTWTPANNGCIPWSLLELGVVEQALVDVDNNFKRASEFLLDNNKTERGIVLAIARDGGYSRTALARKLYNAVEIKKRFKCRAWVHIQHVSKLDNILREIIRQVNADTDGRPISREMQTVECLADWRYLLVFDGIPLEQWSCLEAVLPDGHNGSRVLLTTVAGGGVNMPYDDYHLYIPSRSLDQQMTKVLLCRLIWGHPDFIEYYQGPGADFFFRKTKGIPLAVVFLAGLLRSMPFTQWDEAMRRIPDDADAAESILSLSLDELPLRLKSCFLYFAVFAEDMTIEAQKLVRLWAAEGFLRPQRGRTMEETGQEYLKDLVSRCMIQLVDKDVNDNVVSVGIHGSALAFAQREAEQAGFLAVQDGIDILAPSTARRVSLQNGIDKYLSLGCSTPELHSVLCDIRMTNAGSFMTLHKSRFLRVIDLNGVRLRHLPRGIRSMRHLRYLGLARTGLHRLPLSIGKLINLQTLDITETGVHALPASFWKIQALRHVLASELFVPCTVTVLANLQTLHSARYGWWVILKSAGLSRMAGLRSLQLCGLPSHSRQALLDALSNLELLTSLDLQGDGLPASIFTMLSLHRLENLALRGPLDIAPDSVSNSRYVLPRLARLALSSASVNQEFVNMVIARLPRLAELVLGKDSYADAVLFFPAGGFCCLEKLELRELDAVEEWDMEGALEKLVHVSISNCSRLTRLPERMPDNCAHLQELVLSNVPYVASSIKEGGEDHHKIRHIGYVRVIR